MGYKGKTGMNTLDKALSEQYYFMFIEPTLMDIFDNADCKVCGRFPECTEVLIQKLLSAQYASIKEN